MFEKEVVQIFKQPPSLRCSGLPSTTLTIKFEPVSSALGTSVGNQPVTSAMFFDTPETSQQIKSYLLVTF